jgi:hypothetical protein
MQDGVSDDQFLVFIDDIPNTDFSQTTASGSYRTLSIPFDETAQKIEIIGTVMPPASGSNIISTQGSNNASTGGGGVVKTPEFGSAGAVPMILLSISVLAIIALRSKCSRLCFRSKKQSSTLQ